MTDGGGDSPINANLSLFYDEPSTIDNELLENTRLFDGLFLGNAYAGGDEQFLMNNKIGLIVNCQPLQLKIQANSSVRILTYCFHTARGHIQQSLNMANFSQIADSMHDCIENRLQGVLITAINIDSRNACLGAAYLMARFGWSAQESCSFIQRRKAQTQIADKYFQILRSFEKSQHKAKINSNFESQCGRLHEELIKNTLLNSQIKSIVNFHGLCHRRFKLQQPAEPRTIKLIKFKEEVQIIEPKSRSPISAEQDQNACPHSGQSNQFEEIKIQPQCSNHIENGKLSSDHIENGKLSTVGIKLRNLIREKCHPNLLSGHIEPKSSLKLLRQESGMIIKSRDLIGRRRAASRTEESANQEQQQSFCTVKRNNFVSDSIKQKIQSFQHLFQKKLNAEEKIAKNRIKSISESNSKSQLPKRWQTETISNVEHSNQEDTAKGSNFFKISKSNKASHKKIRSEHPYRAKGFTMSRNDDHLTAVEGVNTLSKAPIEAMHSKTNNCMIGGDHSSHSIQNTLKLHPDSCQGSMKGSILASYPQQRRNSTKMKSRVLPRRIIKQS